MLSLLLAIFIKQFNEDFRPMFQCRKEGGKKRKETAIFHRDNARAMCCKIDTPEIGKGEMGSFVASAVLFRYCFPKIITHLE